jgi:flagellar biosynthesis protein FlhF
MEVKTYRAPSLKAALERIRNELGPNATVLQTREVPAGLLSWFTGGNRIEVTVASGHGQHASTPPRERRRKASHGQTSRAAQAPEVPHAVEPTSGSGASEPVTAGPTTRRSAHSTTRPRTARQPANGLRSRQVPTTPAETNRKLGVMGAPPPTLANESQPAGSEPTFPIHPLPRRTTNPAELAATTGGPSAVRLAPALPATLFSVFTALLEGGFPAELAEQLCHRLRELDPQNRFTDRQQVVLQLQALIAADLVCVPTLTRPLVRQPRIVAFVGPRGVGKSTAIWHLAAAFARTRQQSVGILSVGSSSRAMANQRQASDAWRRCATSLRVTAEHATSPAEALAARGRLDHLDLILVELVGDGPQTEAPAATITPWLEALQADELHLVLSATLGPLSWQQMLTHFQAWQATSLLVTKLDETIQRAQLYSSLRETPIPLSYLTAGIRVPDDFYEAHAEQLAGWILGRERLA